MKDLNPLHALQQKIAFFSFKRESITSSMESVILSLLVISVIVLVVSGFLWFLVGVNGISSIFFCAATALTVLIVAQQMLETINDHLREIAAEYQRLFADELQELEDRKKAANKEL